MTLGLFGAPYRLDPGRIRQVGEVLALCGYTNLPGTLFWWDPERLPFPSKARLANALNVAPRTVQRRIARMERVGLLKREVRRRASGAQTNNQYRLSGLIERIEPYAVQMVSDQKESRRQRDHRRKRGARPSADDGEGQS